MLQMFRTKIIQNGGQMNGSVLQCVSSMWMLLVGSLTATGVGTFCLLLPFKDVRHNISQFLWSHGQSLLFWNCFDKYANNVLNKLGEFTHFEIYLILGQASDHVSSNISEQIRCFEHFLNILNVVWVYFAHWRRWDHGHWNFMNALCKLRI